MCDVAMSLIERTYMNNSGRIRPIANMCEQIYVHFEAAIKLPDAFNKMHIIYLPILYYPIVFAVNIHCEFSQRRVTHLHCNQIRVLQVLVAPTILGKKKKNHPNHHVPDHIFRYQCHREEREQCELIILRCSGECA